MAKIRVKIEDDKGLLLQEKVYELGQQLDNIDLIENAVDQLRSELLPQVSKTLLLAQQDVYKKKRAPEQR